MFTNDIDDTRDLREIFTNNIVLLSILTSLILGVGIGVGSTKIFQIQPEEFREVRTKGQYKFISPLLECENVDVKYSKEIEGLHSKIDSTISKLTSEGTASHISYYLRDLNNGPWTAIDQDEPNSPASLIKLPIAFAVYKQAETTPTLLATVIHNKTEEDTSEQNIKPENTLSANSDYTVEQLLEYMLVYSSNAAFDLLVEFLSENYPGSLKTIYDDLGIQLSPEVNINPSGNTISVRQYASFFRILYNSSYLSKKNSEKILEYLSRSTFDGGIRRGVPPDIQVAHKYGERYFYENKERQLHDCGIVYAPHSPYLICIMTRGDDLNQLSNAIAIISQVTFDSFKSN